MGMTKDQLDRLDAVAESVREGAEETGFGVLSTGEKLYVALAANSMELLKRQGYSIVEALERLGPEDVEYLIGRWKYRG